VHEDIELAPPLAEVAIDLVDLALLRHVARIDGDLGRIGETRHEVGHVVLQPLDGVGERELTPFASKRGCDAPSDAALVRDAHDERLLAFQKSHASSNLMMVNVASGEPSKLVVEVRGALDAELIVLEVEPLVRCMRVLVGLAEAHE
jgi:hypothetical protein